MPKSKLPTCPSCCRPVETAFELPRARVRAVKLHPVPIDRARGNVARVVALPAVRRYLATVESSRGKIIATKKLRPSWSTDGLEMDEIPGSSRFDTHAFEKLDWILERAAKALSTSAHHYTHDRVGWAVRVETTWRSSRFATLDVRLLAFGEDDGRWVMQIFDHETPLAAVEIEPLFGRGAHASTA